MSSANPSPVAYSWRGNAFWLAALLLALLWRGPAFRPALGWQLPRADFPNFVPDFFQDWASARNLFEGRPIYTAHASTVAQYLGLRMDPTDPVFIRENVHPPCSVLLALPLAFLDFRDAFALWNIVSLVFFGISIWVIVGGLRLPFSPWHLLPGGCLLLVCYPLLSQLEHGQLNLCLLLLLTLTWRADRGRLLKKGSDPLTNWQSTSLPATDTLRLEKGSDPFSVSGRGTLAGRGFSLGRPQPSSFFRDICSSISLCWGDGERSSGGRWRSRP